MSAHDDGRDALNDASHLRDVECLVPIDPDDTVIISEKDLRSAQEVLKTALLDATTSGVRWLRGKSAQALADAAATFARAQEVLAKASAEREAAYLMRRQQMHKEHMDTLAAKGAAAMTQAEVEAKIAEAEAVRCEAALKRAKALEKISQGAKALAEAGVSAAQVRRYVAEGMRAVLPP